jgi:hypothetical protein
MKTTITTMATGFAAVMSFMQAGLVEATETEVLCAEAMIAPSVSSPPRIRFAKTVTRSIAVTPLRFDPGAGRRHHGQSASGSRG